MVVVTLRNRCGLVDKETRTESQILIIHQVHQTTRPFENNLVLNPYQTNQDVLKVVFEI